MPTSDELMRADLWVIFAGVIIISSTLLFVAWYFREPDAGKPIYPNESEESKLERNRANNAGKGPGHFNGGGF